VRLAATLCCGLALCAGWVGCAAGDPPSGKGSGKAGGSSGAGSAGDGATAGISAAAGAGGTAAVGGAGTSSMEMLEECPAVSQTAENKLQPADIIIGIDTSGSMGEEIALVQQNMNAFSQQIIDSGVDAHVILLATAGSPDPNAMSNCVVFFPGTPCVSVGGGNFSLCIGAPLGSGMCPADSKLPVYAHVDQTIGSRDMLGLFISAYPAYKANLRVDSLKTFVAISDDNATDPPINSAAAFMSAVATLDPDPAMWADWNYSGIFCETQCAAAAAIGTVHADLVAMTGGAKGDLCLQDFKPVLDALAKKVVDSVKLACEWEIPPPPDAKVFEPGKTNVKLTIEGTEELLGKAASAAKCDAKGGWHYDNETAPTKVLVCPATCDRMQAAKEAQVNVLFGCDTVPVVVE
jgi:hypothetical protein